jgi:predicted nucleotide-binding protein
MIDQKLLRQIENTVNDLRSTDYPSFDRHIKKLAGLLHAPELAEITEKLTKDIDLNGWLEAGASRMSSMVGSGKLDWPADQEQELGTVIKLVDKFAEMPDWARAYFARNFYYVDGDFGVQLRNLAEQILVPFARDFIAYVDSVAGANAQAAMPHEASKARRVFIVHGHDEGSREAVARFLEGIGFEAVILHEQPNKGRTVIEKFEAHGEVGFVVVLLTPDDTGSAAGNPPLARARQNVILEWGYFIGKLGRSRVCALKKGEVELPSDILGIVWESFDEHGGWRQKLAKELSAAGFEIDWNKVMHP